MQEVDLFRSKYKMSFEDFWRKFYDSQIFDFNTILTNSGKLLFQNSRSSFAEHLVVNSVKLRSDRFWAISWVGGGADEFYSKIDRTLLSREIIAFRMELFGNEWLSKLEETPYYSEHSISDNDRFAEMSFAKSYLEKKGRSDIWDAMLEYNKTFINIITSNRKPEAVCLLDMALDDLNKRRKTFKTELEFTFWTIIFNRMNGIEIDLFDCEVEPLAAMLAKRAGFDTKIDSNTFQLFIKTIIKIIHLEISYLFSNVVTINPSWHGVSGKPYTQ